MKSSTPPLEQALAWLHLKCELPADWEVTAYAIEKRIGRMEFSTREGLQSLFSWEPCRKAPDPDITMKGFLEKLFPARGLSAGLAGDVVVESCGPWMLAMAPEGPAKAIWYQAESQVLLSWVFEPATRESLRGILQSCVANEGPIREYQLHGIHARVPENYEVEAISFFEKNLIFFFVALSLLLPGQNCLSTPSITHRFYELPNSNSPPLMQRCC